MQSSDTPSTQSFGGTLTDFSPQLFSPLITRVESKRNFLKWIFRVRISDIVSVHGAIRPPVPRTKMPAERSSLATHNLPECSARVFRNSRVLCVVDGEMPHSLPPLAQFTEPLDRQFPEPRCRQSEVPSPHTTYRSALHEYSATRACSA
ncbi:hypothetical protein J6590_105974 [Homalodisca vitripennis]|nr:hypothetical protein J6590_105974 [Homalodisca vitripennis]